MKIAAFPVRVDRAHKVQVLRHRLPPFLCEAFGGSTGLVDVGVHRLPHDHAVRQHGDTREAHLDVSATPNEAALLDDHDKHDPVAQVENLLWLDPELLISAVKSSKKPRIAADSLEAGTHPHRLQDCVGRVEAHRRVKVTTIRSLKRFPRKLHQVGGRGLLSHRPPSIQVFVVRFG